MRDDVQWENEGGEWNIYEIVCRVFYQAGKV